MGKFEPPRRHVSIGGTRMAKTRLSPLTGALSAMVAAVFGRGMPKVQYGNTRSSIEDAGRRAMAATQASRDAHYESIKDEAMAGACPSCGSAEHRLCGVVMAEDVPPVTPEQLDANFKALQADPFAPIEEPTASMTGLVNAGEPGRYTCDNPSACTRSACYAVEGCAQAMTDATVAKLRDADVTRPGDWPRLIPTEQSPGWTGNPPGLLQDDSRDLSRALASKPDAMRRAREAAAEAQALNAAAPLPIPKLSHELRLQYAVEDAREAGLHYEPQDEARLQHDMAMARIAADHDLTYAELEHALQSGPPTVPQRYTDEAIQAAADRKGITPEQARKALEGAREIDCIACSRAPGGACPHDRPGAPLPVDCTLAYEIRRAARAEADKHPPGALINNDDVPRGPAFTGYFTLPPLKSRLIAHRVESERERRERLLAEWVAHREAAPMEPGRVPGEPMPRSEEELIEQAWQLIPLHVANTLTTDRMGLMRFLFSMALTYCQQERRPFYEEHDGNRLVHSMVRSARGMGA
jgi:hypothetical protein